MPVTVTREMINSRLTSVTGGNRNPDLHIRDVPDFIPIVSRLDTPTLQILGSSKQHDKLEIEYGEGDIVPRTVELGEDIDGSETEFTLAAGHGNRVQQWDLIKFGDEVVLVTAAPTANSLGTVTRGWASSTATTHLTGATGRVLGPAVPEGVNAPSSPSADGVTFINFMQILEYTFELTHRARVTKNYEFMTDRFKKELSKKMKEAALDLNNLSLYGLKNAGDMSGTNPSTTGGLFEATTTYATDLLGEPLSLFDIMQNLQDIFNDVGREDMGKVMMGNMTTKRIFDSFFGQFRRYQGREDIAKINWDGYQSSFGLLKFTVNYDMGDGELIVWNPKDCDRLHYTGGNWSTGVYATQGWYDKGFLRGDFGFRWEGDRRRMKITNFSYDLENDYPNIDS